MKIKLSDGTLISATSIRSITIDRLSLRTSIVMLDGKTIKLFYTCSEQQIKEMEEIYKEMKS